MHERVNDLSKQTRKRESVTIIARTLNMDNRRNNGGNSTKSSGLDSRKNQYKSALAEASTKDDVIQVILSLKDKALTGDVHACKLYLEYYLGKPTQKLDVTTEYRVPEWITELLEYDEDKLNEIYGV